MSVFPHDLIIYAFWKNTLSYFLTSHLFLNPFKFSLLSHFAMEPHVLQVINDFLVTKCKASPATLNTAARYFLQLSPMASENVLFLLFNLSLLIPFILPSYTVFKGKYSLKCCPWLSIHSITISTSLSLTSILSPT